MPLRKLRIVNEPHARAEQRQHLVDSLDAFNVAATSMSEFSPIHLFVKDGRGNVFGGLLGLIWGGWLHVRILWIAEPLRHRGYGRKLLQAAEAAAKDLECVGSFLETHSFQARPFYEKLGYRVIGTHENIPVGHKKHFLEKRFRAPGKPRSKGKRGAPKPSRAGSAPKG